MHERAHVCGAQLARVKTCGGVMLSQRCSTDLHWDETTFDEEEPHAHDEHVRQWPRIHRHRGLGLASRRHRTVRSMGCVARVRPDLLGRTRARCNR